MGNIGIFGPTIKGYGCIDESNLTYGLIAKEIESIDSGYRSMFSVQSSLVMLPIYKFGSDYLKNKYIPDLACGNLIGCFGLTESNAGSDPALMKTYAIEDNDNYIINGHKIWISNAPIADIFIIWAKHNNLLHLCTFKTPIFLKVFYFLNII
jgi:glutaryl-CoA dehydrogenase